MKGQDRIRRGNRNGGQGSRERQAEEGRGKTKLFVTVLTLTSLKVFLNYMV